MILQYRPRWSEAGVVEVIFELGYFVGKLGRSKVMSFYKDELTLPSDYHGVLYVRLDADEGWKLRLAKEMKQAGLPIDLNNIFG